MWKAWMCTRPVMQTVHRASGVCQRGLAETTAPRPAVAAVATQVQGKRELKPSGKQAWKVRAVTLQFYILIRWSLDGMQLCEIPYISRFLTWTFNEKAKAHYRLALLASIPEPTNF